MGYDPDEKLNDPEYLQKLPEEEQQHILEAKQRVEKEIETTVDLAHYSLSSDAFASLLPELEIHHFHTMERLVLKGNQIDDNGLLELCDCLLSANARNFSELDLSDTEVKDKGVSCLIEVMAKQCTKIVAVDVSGCTGVSMQVKQQLEAACRKNKVVVDEYRKINQMHAAAEKLDYYDKEINYVGKEQWKQDKYNQDL